MPTLSTSSTAGAQTSGEQVLRRDLRRWHVLAIVVGSIVGTGIYIRPASVAQLVSSPTAIMGVWLLGGALSLCGALTYARLATQIPGTGGEYLFLRTTLGTFPAFLYGWMRLIVSPAVIAFMAVAFTVFLGDLLPLGSAWFQVPLAAGHVVHYLDIGPRQAIAVGVILGLSWINSRGVGRAGTFQLLVTTCKVIGLGLLIVAITAFGSSSPQLSVIHTLQQDSSVLTFGGALLAVMAAYNGWANAALVGGEIQDANRVLPWALVTGVVIVTGLYITANLAFLHALSLQDIVSANSTAYPNAPSVASKAVHRVLSSRASAGLPVIFAVSALGAAHCNVLAIPRVIMSMAQDGLLPHALANVSRQSGTPTTAIWAIGGLAAVFAVVGTYDRLSNMTTFAFLVFFALTTVGFLWSSRGQPRHARNRAFWGASVIAALFLLGTGALIAALIMRGTSEVLTAIALIGIGIPIYAVLEILRRRRFDRLGNASLR
jgi:basic amino acid/polyamine antiporter, APA family